MAEARTTSETGFQPPSLFSTPALPLLKGTGGVTAVWGGKWQDYFASWLLPTFGLGISILSFIKSVTASG